MRGRWGKTVFPLPSTPVSFASFFQRAIAFILDLCLLGMTTLVMSVMVGVITQDNYIDGVGEASGTAFVLIALFVHPFMTLAILCYVA